MSTAEIVFQKFDHDRSGSIDIKEFQALCYNLGYMLTDAEIKYAVLTLDKDGSGKIEVNEFKSWWGTPDRWGKLFLSVDELKARNAAANVFRRFDPTGSGNIRNCDFDALHQTLIEFDLTTKSRDSCQEDLDKNRDLTIQFSEYIEWLGRQHNWASKIPEECKSPMDTAYDSKVAAPRTRGISKPNLERIEAIPSRKVLMIVNHFVVSTTDFVNKLLVHCEQKLGKISLDVQRLEILLRILEGKLDSIDWLAKAHPKAATTSDSGAAEQPAVPSAPVDSSGVPPPPSGIPPPPSGVSPPGVGASTSSSAPPQTPSPAPAQGPKLKEDPRFVKYFRMLKLGVPPPVIEMKMKQEGFDPAIIKLDPEGPVSAADAFTGGSSSQPPPADQAPAPPTASSSKPSAGMSNLDADAKALVTVEGSDSESEDDDFED
mmetsp:Transcript_27052/g.37653  ORF Transcript_27052/g.37653 Transcript_27052/m.37653 type:complete len:430 (+) Transcript_27052:138-1427(+)